MSTADSDRAAKAEALLALLESRIARLEMPQTQTMEEVAVLKDTVARLEYRVDILVAALKDADKKIEELSRANA